MKRLVLSAILGLSLANAASFDIGIGTGYIDDEKKDVIVKFRQNINPYLGFGGKFANDYLKTYISTIPNFVNDKFLLNGAIGFEKYKIENKNEIQGFIEYKVLLGTKTNFIPKASIQIGTKSVEAGIGIFYTPSKKFNFEYQIGKRWLFKRVNDTKSTTSTAIYIDYSF